jgi:hypothetical protein
MNAFERVPFGEVLRDVSAGKAKVPQSAYLKAGRFAIVDQGSQSIAGYTNAESDLSGSDLPAIVFGDHTRRFKFIDHPFAIGADGVKVLKASPRLDTRFAFWYLSSVQLPNAGYSRHFKFLKEVTIPLPSLPEQRRIATILDQAENLRAARRRSIALISDLTHAALDVALSSSVASVVELGSVCSRITDGTHQAPKWAESGVPFLFVSNLMSGRIDFSTEKYVSNETYEELTRGAAIEPGDVLYTAVGSYGVPAVVEDDRRFIFQRHIAHLKPRPDLLDSLFLRGVLASPELRHQADRVARGVAQKTLTLGEISRLRIPMISIEAQRAYAQRISELERRRQLLREHLALVDELFASLQHRAFEGLL